MEKDSIISVLGEDSLLLPDWIGEGLAANERAKFFFTLLQMACWCADHPDAPRPDLDPDKQACGLTEPWIDSVMAGARQGEFGYIVPQAERLIERLFDEIAVMLRPLLAPVSLPGDDAKALAQRLDALKATIEVRGNQIEDDLAHRITAVETDGTDSLHRLVMDIHKQLNGLQTAIAPVSIEGAATYKLGDGDSDLVSAFMRGLNATAPLKFGHPGLGTTATRTGDRLIIQNDIGTTDAHVLVIHIDGLTATLTYADIHLERLNFFRSLFDNFGVVWHKIENRQSKEIGNNGFFHLNSGTLVAENRQALGDYLCHLGSCLVFLIDWNRARKRLRLLVSKETALELLRWAALNRLGHRAFLLLGGEKLVFETLTFAAKAPLPYGAGLDEMLGDAAAIDYLRFLFRTATEGLLAGRSEALIRVEAQAELITRLSSTDELVLAMVANHATLILKTATAIRDTVLHAAEGDGETAFDTTAQSAKNWESAADHLVVQARALIKRAGSPFVLRRLMEEADDAIDELEDAAFLLTLQPMRTVSTEMFGAHRDLARLVVTGAEEWCKVVASAPAVRRRGAHEDLLLFLEAVEAVVTVEHQGDVAERETKVNILALAEDFRQLYTLGEFAAHLEAATDALMRAAKILSEHILNDVITS